jgi:3-oxoacyl-[acyl-carrier protein] reductase
MLVDLSEKVAIVTGSTRGIGLEVAKRLAQSGAHVIVNARHSDQRLAEAEDAVRNAAAGQVIAAAADVGTQAGAAALAKLAFDKFRRVDILVNNAGILKEGLIGMIGNDDIKSMIDANLMSVINMTQSVSRIMVRRKSGAIVNLSSIMGLRGRPGQFVYSATKAAIVGATLSAAKELAKFDIRINAVAPGYIETAMTAHIDDNQRLLLINAIPLARAGTANDVANAICFLVSDQARYITGQVLGVDGGMVA